MSDVTEVTPSLLRRMPLPHLESGDKEARGRVLVVAGCTELAGVPLLTGTAVLRAGAGKLQIATGRSIATTLAIAVPEARVIALPETDTGAIAPEAADVLLPRASAYGAVVMGPGMVDEDAAEALTVGMLKGLDGRPILLDAATMMRLANQRELLRRHGGRIVITPHPGEVAGMLGIDKSAVESNPLAVARRLAAMLHVVVAMKSAHTWIVGPDGDAWLFREGCIGLATAGSGDVLAGVIGGLLARGCDPVRATIWGVALHAAAGHRLSVRHGPVGFLARELPGEIPAVMNGLT